VIVAGNTARDEAIMRCGSILFDVDGTLLDSIEDLANSMNTVLRRFNLREHSIETYKYFVGDGMENLVVRSLPEIERDDRRLVEQCIASMREEYSRNWNVRTRPYAQIPELLDVLEQRKIRMAVLSNKPDDFTRMMVKELLPGRRFEIVMGERPAVPRKPHPAAALEIARLMNIPPSRFLYVGDTATDMKTAKAAGMFAVGVLWGFREAGELLASGAELLIHQPLELLDLLDR